VKGIRLLLLLTLHSSLFTVVLGCRVSLSPVKNRIGVGVESYVIFDAAGENGEGDLYAGSASGGKAFRVTFSRVHESSPALSPDGVMLAFIRGPHAADSAGHRVWIMNLLNGSEREMPEMGEGAYPQRVGWALDGSSLLVRTSQGDFRLAPPPGDPNPQPVAAALQPGADTLLGVPLGLPVAGLARECAEGVCALTPGGETVLAEGGRTPFRWGRDSVAYFRGASIEIRPLGGGTTRHLRWADMPLNPRTASQFPGTIQAGEIR
jgi:hypothetical protein